LARALVAALEARAQVINLSIGGPADPLLGDLIDEGLRRGIVFVGAAPSNANEFDGSLMRGHGVIKVSNADSYSDDTSVVSAPGREILTLVPGNRYDFASGASIATAQVSGVVALMLAKNSALVPSNVYELLRKTSVHGLVDACGAVVATVGHGYCARGMSRTRQVGESRP
jgi:subtilisin family serine protease